MNMTTVYEFVFSDVKMPSIYKHYEIQFMIIKMSYTHYELQFMIIKILGPLIVNMSEI